MKGFSAVILAAGASKRLGFNKLTLKMNGESVITASRTPLHICRYWKSLHRNR